MRLSHRKETAMIEEEDSVFRVDKDTFDFYLVFRDVLPNKLEINGSWKQIFSIDSEEIKKKLSVDGSHQSAGWQKKHINGLPRALKKLQNLSLVRELSEKEFSIVKRLWRLNGQFPKKLYEVKWAGAECFANAKGEPLIQTRKKPKKPRKKLPKCLYQKAGA